MTKREAYYVFGLSLNQPITLDLIKNRYRILTKTYHPDNPRTGSEEMMAKVNLAFDALRTYNFDPEDEDAPRQQYRGKGFAKDFNPDFTPFEFGARDESFYQNNNYNSRGNYSRNNYNRYERNSSYSRNENTNGRYNSRGQFERNDKETSQGYEESYEEEKPANVKKKKRGGIFILFRMIGRICKLFILLGILAFFAAVPVCIYFFGFNKRGLFLAGAALVMAILSILVFKFFSELIR